MALERTATQTALDEPWQGFKPGPWPSRINVHDFIQRNYTPYEGDASFLAGPTERTQNVWDTLPPLTIEVR
jgi:formate C-acetyltransferase